MHIPSLSPPRAGIFFGRSIRGVLIDTIAKVARNIHAIILAAGRAQRFGGTKLLEEYDGAPLLHRALDVARSVCHENTWLVTGHAAQDMADAAEGRVGHIVHNREYARGIGSSIACGAGACPESVDALLVLLADQPLVSRSHIANLIRRWTGEPGAIVATAFSGVLGPPVLFGRGYLEELRALGGDAGARQVLDAHADAVTTVRYDPAGVDIDTPEDLQRLVRPR